MRASSLRFDAPKKPKKQVCKNEHGAVLINCFKEQIRLGMLTPREAAFANDIISRYELYGRLTNKQYEAVYKTQMRLIMERDLPS